MKMHTKTLWSFLLLYFLIGCIGCDREIPPGFEPTPVVGYRIEGVVRDGFANPMAGVSVTVEYSPEYVNGGPPPSRDFTVTNSNQIVRVRVYDALERLVRTVYSGTPGIGNFYLPWDKLDASGQPVASGLYWVHYEVGGQSQKSYPVIVDEAVTARTDSTGFFVIGDQNLPLGFYPYAMYASDGTTFWGNYRVGERVFLIFNAAGITRSQSVGPERNQLTTVIITFN